MRREPLTNFATTTHHLNEITHKHSPKLVRSSATRPDFARPSAPLRVVIAPPRPPQPPSRSQWYTRSMTPNTQASQPAPALAPADIDRLADEIAEVASHIDAAEHRLLTLIRRFDDGSGWATHGALSCAHWLNWRIGLDLGAARERVRVARALGGLPLVDGALRRGAISYSKVRAITRVASAATEATLLEMATHATASQLERICRGYRRVLDDAATARADSLADEELRRFVRVRDTDDGMVRIEVRLRPDEAAVVLQALDVARQRAWREGATPRAAEADVDPPRASVAAIGVSAETSPPPRATSARPAHEPPPGLSRADALVAVAEDYLCSAAAGGGHDGAGPPVELVVHVDHEALLERVAAVTSAAAVAAPEDATPARTCATLADGTAVALATARRLACDASVVIVGGDDRAPDPSRRTRRISPRLRRALRLRDDGCRFPGCTNRRTDAHHVVHWTHGGATSLANLCSLCRRHHRLVHEHGYRIRTDRDGTPRFIRGDGSPVPLADEDLRAQRRVAARTTMESHDGSATLRATHATLGLGIDSSTAAPRWDGAPVDYGLAVQALLVTASVG